MQVIQRLLPRHIEIMRRLSIGESQRDIARSLDMNEGRLSIIVNSPLFQLELRKMQRRQEDRVALIHEKIIIGAEKAVDLHNEVIDGVVMMKDGEDTLAIPVPLTARLQSSTAMANLFLRLHRGASLDMDEEGEGEPYEARLEREVTFKETTVTRKKGKVKTKEMETLDATLDATHPSLEVMEAAEDEALDLYAAEGARA